MEIVVKGGGANRPLDCTPSTNDNASGGKSSDFVVKGRAGKNPTGKYRRDFGQRAKSRHRQKGSHDSIVLKDTENDTLEWEYADPFWIDVDFDPAFDPEPGAPPHPFTNGSWPSRLMKSTLSGGKHGLSGTFDQGNSDVYKQTFYKYTIWADGLKHDPEIICER
jgi:hypothetical protein